MIRLLATTLLLLVGCASGDLMRDRKGKCFLVAPVGLGDVLRRVHPMNEAACTFTEGVGAVFRSKEDAEACSMARVEVEYACANVEVPMGEEERDGK